MSGESTCARVRPLVEPLLSASLYCSGRLDEVIYRCIAPFWSSVRASAPEHHAYLWMIRYPRGGEHLKLRIHAPDELGPVLRTSLERAASDYLAAIGPAEAAPAGRRHDVSPPIDVEDEAPTAHLDHSFLWTRYQRSHVSFGGPPLLDDDDYIARFTVCLGLACDRALTAIRPGPQGRVPFQSRQITLLKALISGLAGLGWTDLQRSAYLAYHRNWLLRFILAQSGQGADAAARLLARFDANLATLGATLETLQRTADATWLSSSARSDPTASPHEEWRAAVRELCAYVTPFAGRPDYQIDPFAPDPRSSTLFKLLHGVANQLGLGPSDESFAYHVLLCLSAGMERYRDERYGFSIEPPAPLAAP